MFLEPKLFDEKERKRRDAAAFIVTRTVREVARIRKAKRTGARPKVIERVALFYNLKKNQIIYKTPSK